MSENTVVASSIETATSTLTSTETETVTQTETMTDTTTETQTQTTTDTTTETETETMTETCTETETAPEAAAVAKPSLWSRAKGWLVSGVSFVARHDIATTCGAGALAVGFGVFGMVTIAAVFGVVAVVGLGMFLARTFSEKFRSFFGLNKPSFKKAETKSN